MSTSQLTPEQAVALMHRFNAEVQQGNDHNSLDELCHPDFEYKLAPEGTPNDRNHVHVLTTGIHQAFADMTYEIVHCVSDGKVVATNKIFRGRQVGDFMGQQATGKRIEMPVMDFVTIVDGKFKDHWGTHGQVKVLED